MGRNGKKAICVRWKMTGSKIESSLTVWVSVELNNCMISSIKKYMRRNSQCFFFFTFSIRRRAFFKFNTKENLLRWKRPFLLWMWKKNNKPNDVLSCRHKNNKLIVQSANKISKKKRLKRGFFSYQHWLNLGAIDSLLVSWSRRSFKERNDNERRASRKNKCLRWHIVTKAVQKLVIAPFIPYIQPDTMRIKKNCVQCEWSYKKYHKHKTQHIERTVYCT